MSISAKTKQENSTFKAKASLRISALRELTEPPVVLETHGGWGKLYLRCYRSVEQGVVFEQKPEKTAALARQRPSWAVYEGDCIAALEAGAGAHLTVNFFDCDPFGECWPVLDAWFESERPRAKRLVLVVNDGLRHKLGATGGWDVESMREMVEKYGNGTLHAKYLEICRELVTLKAGKLGYKLLRWVGSYAGDGKRMTHFAATLELN